jgi:hypothetical protein
MANANAIQSACQFADFIRHPIADERAIVLQVRGQRAAMPPERDYG